MILGILAAQAESIRHRRSMAREDVAAAPAGGGHMDELIDPFPVPSGVRYQLFRALRAMDKGEAMVVERRVPDAARHVMNGRRREEWLRSLRSAEAWRTSPDIVPLLVPGTAFPRVIGSIVINSGWCAPSTEPHWVPNLRFFLLTDAGHESFLCACQWWSKLSALQRLQAMLME